MEVLYEDNHLIIVNKNWKELNYYQNQAKECGFNITWQIV